MGCIQKTLKTLVREFKGLYLDSYTGESINIDLTPRIEIKTYKGVLKNE